MSELAALAGLRRCVLAVSVLEDVDVEAREQAVLLAGSPPVTVAWADVAEAVRGFAEPACDPAQAVHEPARAVHEPAEDAGARHRLTVLLRLLRLVGDLGGEAAAVLAERSRPMAVPATSARHPGPGWVRERLPGGALDLGGGVQGLLSDRDAVVPLPPAVARAAGAPVASWWPQLLARAERMGALAVDRLVRDGAGTRAAIRPVGGCDVPTLLASPRLRRYLAGLDGSGMRAVAVPMRSRGWYDLLRVDPAFVAAAWMATEPQERGLRRPVLVTADEVALPRSGGDPAGFLLAEEAALRRRRR